MHYYKNKSSLKKHSFAGFSPLKVSVNIVTERHVVYDHVGGSGTSSLGI
jgi:hypothetical protein